MVSSMEFIVSEVPASLHAILLGLWLFARSVDNMLVIFINTKINDPFKEAFIYLGGIILLALISLKFVWNFKSFQIVEVVEIENDTPQNKR